MATQQPSPRNRALRPAAEDLESRQLLSKVVTGTDSKGDTWTLRLIGPGTLNVVKQNGADGKPAPLNSETDINTITVAGTDPLASRLVGTVKAAPGSDGKVYFQTFTELQSVSEKLTGAGLGPLAVNMPQFWLANTTPASSFSSSTATPSISIPDGVATLRFGGVDTSHNQPPSSSASNNTYNVNLGLPQYGGTRIIIDKSISSTQTMTSSSSSTPTILQHGVVFAVAGRLSLFQANEIDGNASNPPGQFSDQVSTATGTGGTIVASETANTPPFLTFTPQAISSVTGQIGNLRIGGNATNLTALVEDSTAGGNARITNFSVGGETNNVLVVAPNGLKNAAFGAGMDTTDILTDVINTLQANRGALNSNVYVNRTISQVRLGGDVANTNVLTGVVQNFATIFSNITGVSSSGVSGSPTAPPTPSNAQIGGGMTVLVAGNVTDSVFSASVQPFNSIFGDPNQLVLPSGHIAAKVQGTISNIGATPSAPNTAFYAAQVHLNHGPVIPPNVPQPPYAGPMRPVHAPGLHNPLHIQQLKGLRTLPIERRLFSGGVAVPRGPRATK
jgi:hypothetical protein